MLKINITRCSSDRVSGHDKSLAAGAAGGREVSSGASGTGAAGETGGEAALALDRSGGAQRD